MGVGRRRLRRALELTRAARRGHVVRVLREIGGGATSEPTPERAREFREALEELGTTFVKLGQILSSRPGLLPDAYIEELGRLATLFHRMVDDFLSYAVEDEPEQPPVTA